MKAIPIMYRLTVALFLAAYSALSAENLCVLNGTITDAESGALSPCTVKIVDSQGRTATESASFLEGFRCPGQFSQRLPAGLTRIIVTRGFETLMENRELILTPDKEANVQITLRRRVDLRKRNWFSGDSHAHMIHGEKTIATDFDSVARTARAEDLRYLSLAQAWTLPDPTPENLAFELDRRSTPDCALTWNLEAPKNYYHGDAGKCLGHCWNLGVKGRTTNGEDVISLLMQASAHDYESSKPSFANFESHALIHRQGGSVFYTHPARWWTGAWGGQGGFPKVEKMRISNLAVELPLDTLLGPTYDGIDIITGDGERQADGMAFDLWCMLLNHGYRIAATASSDACFDRRDGARPGAARLYTYLDHGFSWPAIANATAKGNNFVTSGPLLVALVDGHPPGTAFAAGNLEHSLSIEGWASGTDTNGLVRAEVLRNGIVCWSNHWTSPLPSFTAHVPLLEIQDAWYCVRLYGGDARNRYAVSGAFYFETKPYRPPLPTPAHINISLRDAENGTSLAGTVTEVSFLSTWHQEGKEHAVGEEGTALTVPGTVRLRAQVKGYQPVTLSPFFDNPALVEMITGLAAEDLTRWETFERIKTLLGQATLTFQLPRIQQK